MIWICKETSNYMCQITVEECVWVCVWESFLSFMTEAFCTISCESLFFYWFMNHSDISVCLTDSSSVHHCSSSHWRYSSVITVNMYENLNTHTHTHTRVYVCVCVYSDLNQCVCVFVSDCIFFRTLCRLIGAGGFNSRPQSSCDEHTVVIMEWNHRPALTITQTSISSFLLHSNLITHTVHCWNYRLNTQCQYSDSFGRKQT